MAKRTVVKDIIRIQSGGIKSPGVVFNSQYKAICRRLIVFFGAGEAMSDSKQDPVDLTQEDDVSDEEHPSQVATQPLPDEEEDSGPEEKEAKEEKEAPAPKRRRVAPEEVDPKKFQTTTWCATIQEPADMKKFHEKFQDVDWVSLNVYPCADAIAEVLANNEDGDALDELADHWIRACVYQEEKGEKKQRNHYQITIQTMKKVTMNGLKKKLGCKTMHLEVCRALNASIAYCKKEEGRVAGPWSFGEFAAERARTDWKVVKAMTKNGAPVARIAEHFYSDFVRYHSGILKARQYLMKAPKTREVQVTILYGATGVGKSHWAHSLCSDQEDPYTMFHYNGDTLWFDGYDNQKVIIFDEWNAQIPITEMNRICDKWRYQARIKGGSTPAMWDHVVLCTNFMGWTWWTSAPEGVRKAFQRRVTKIYRCEVQVSDEAEPVFSRVEMSKEEFFH